MHSFIYFSINDSDSAIFGVSLEKGLSFQLSQLQRGNDVGDAYQVC